MHKEEVDVNREQVGMRKEEVDVNREQVGMNEGAGGYE